MDAVVGTNRLVMLPGVTAGARMSRSVAWPLSFADALSRDDLFACLGARLRRRVNWGGVAHRQDTEALTSYLLSVFDATDGLLR